MNDTFDSKDGEQNIAQGENAIGKQENVVQTVIEDGCIFSGSGNVTVNGIPPALFAEYAGKLAVTESALASFFKILEEQQVPRGDLDSKLREIAFRHKELLLRFGAVQSDDPQVKALKEQAGQAIENGDYDRADALLNQIDERHNNAIHQLHQLQAETAARLEKEQLGKAENLASRARLQRLQYRYEKSAQYYKEAAAALPEGRKYERAIFLGAAGYDFLLIASYADAMSLHEQSLLIFREIGDRKQEGVTLNNISKVFQMKGNYSNALDYLEQSLPICREVGDKHGEGVTLSNISQIYYANGDCSQALKHLERSLSLRMETQNKEGEGRTLTNIGLIHNAQGDYAVALKYCQQALAIAHESKDRRLESSVLKNIGTIYYIQKNYNAALEQYKQSLVIRQQIGDRRNEGTTLNNISAIYMIKGDCIAALEYHERALAIAKEIGDKAGEATYSWNIGVLYEDQGELAKAEPYLGRAVELKEQLEHPKLEEYRKALEWVRAKLRGQR